MKYTVVGTKFGWVGIGGSERGLRFISLPRLTPEAAVEDLDDCEKWSVEEQSMLGDLPSRLKRYFDGEAVIFNDKLDFGGATIFEKNVWDITRSIPYGETRSYGWVASRVGKPNAARAVGQAMARNRVPIIVPCHRVVSSNGGLGGFGGGLELKRRLLELESLSGN